MKHIIVWENAQASNLEKCLIYLPSTTSQFLRFFNWMVLDLLFFVAWQWKRSISPPTPPYPNPDPNLPILSGYQLLMSPKLYISPKIVHLERGGYLLIRGYLLYKTTNKHVRLSVCLANGDVALYGVAFSQLDCLYYGVAHSIVTRMGKHIFLA